MAHDSLSSLLQTVDRQTIVAEIADLVRVKIQERSGIRGTIIRKGYNSALKLRPDIDKRGVNYLFDDLVLALEPHYAAFLGSGNADMRQFFEHHQEAVASSLLGAVDNKAATLNNKQLRALFKTFRKGAEAEIVPVVPDIGELIGGYHNQAVAQAQ